MAMLVSAQEAQSFIVEARIQKMKADNADRFDEVEDKLRSGEYVAYRASSDGKIEFLTEEQYNRLWQEKQ